MPITKFPAVAVYKLDEPYDSDHPEYTYAIPMEYAVGAVIGDCWIVNEEGEKLPGYDVCPVPVSFDSVDDYHCSVDDLEYAP